MRFPVRITVLSLALGLLAGGCVRQAAKPPASLVSGSAPGAETSGLPAPGEPYALFLLALDAYVHRDYEAASATMKALTKAYPAETDFLQFYAQVTFNQYIHQNFSHTNVAKISPEPLKDSYAAIMESIRLAPKDSENFDFLNDIGQELIKYYFLVRQPDKVASTVQEIIAVHPEFPNSYGFLGDAYQLMGKRSEAEEAYRAAVDKAPRDHEAMDRLVQFYWSRKDYDKALKWLDKIEALYPMFPIVQMQRAQIFLEMNQPEKALPLLQELVGDADYGLVAVTKLLEYYLDQKDLVKAEEIAAIGRMRHVREALQLMLVYGEALAERRYYAKAEEIYRRLLQDFPTAFEPYEALFWLSFDQGRPDAALNVLSAVASQFAAEERYYLLVGLAYRKLDKPAEALQIFQKGLQLFPSNPRLSFQAAVVLEQQGKVEECAETLRRLLEITPQDDSALNFLGYLYAEHGMHLDEAEKLIRRALEIDPGNGAYLDSLGWVYYQQGRYKESVETLTQAAEKEVGDATVLEHLGDALLKAGEKKKAQEMWQKAFGVLKPNDDPKVRERLTVKAGVKSDK